MRPVIPWPEVSKLIKTRIARQVRTHAQKYYIKLKRQEKQQQNIKMNFYTKQETVMCRPIPLVKRQESLKMFSLDFAFDEDRTNF